MSSSGIKKKILFGIASNCFYLFVLKSEGRHFMLLFTETYLNIFYNKSTNH